MPGNQAPAQTISVKQNLGIPIIDISDNSEDTVPDIELEDQFKKKVSHNFPKDKWSVIFVAGRKGADQIEPWAKAIYEGYGDSVEQIGVADVSTVPAPIRGLIRAVFRKTVDYPILMDWEGKVTQKLGYKSGLVRLFVVSPSGTIQFEVDGPLTKSRKEQLFGHLPMPTQTD